MQDTSFGTSPDVLIAGHVTRDVFGDRVSLGGAASFAAQAASCLGLSACVVTAAPEPFSLLAPLERDERLRICRAPCQQETTFHLSYGPNGRDLRVSSKAPPLTLDDVPVHLRRVPLAFVAPLIGECDRAFVEGIEGIIVAGIQGWLRTLGPAGEVRPALSPLVHTPPKNLDAAVFSELDHPEADALARHLASCGVVVALTRGREGVSLFLPERVDVPASPAVEVDPTGAGDVFGLVFGMGLTQKLAPVAAAERAAEAAARVVEGPGLGNLNTYLAGAVPMSARTARARFRGPKSQAPAAKTSIAQSVARGL